MQPATKRSAPVPGAATSKVKSAPAIHCDMADKGCFRLRPASARHGVPGPVAPSKEYPTKTAWPHNSSLPASRLPDSALHRRILTLPPNPPAADSVLLCGIRSKPTRHSRCRHKLPNANPLSPPRERVRVRGARPSRSHAAIFKADGKWGQCQDAPALFFTKKYWTIFPAGVKTLYRAWAGSLFRP